MTNTAVAFEQPTQSNLIDEVATTNQLTLTERIALVDPETFKRCLAKVVGVIHFNVFPHLALKNFTCTIGQQNFTMMELLSVKDSYLG